MNQAIADLIKEQNAQREEIVSRVIQNDELQRRLWAVFDAARNMAESAYHPSKEDWNRLFKAVGMVPTRMRPR